MTLVNHEVLGEGYYFITQKDQLTFIDKQYRRIVKKLLKRGYKELTREQVDEKLADFIDRFVKSLKTNTLYYYIDGRTVKTTTDILKLWYSDGFCHYKTFIDGKVDAKTMSGNIIIDTCDEDINMYPTILVFEDYGFGGDVCKQKIFDEDLEKLYLMYGSKV